MDVAITEMPQEHDTLTVGEMITILQEAIHARRECGWEDNREWKKQAIADIKTLEQFDSSEIYDYSMLNRP